LLASGGVPTTTPEFREASYHFLRDEEGRVTEVAAHDGTGHVLWSLIHSTPSRARYAERAGPWRGAPAEPAPFELVPDGSGAVREVWHVDAEGRRTPARRGVHGLRVETGDAGEVRLTLLDGSGKPTGPAPRWALRSTHAAGRAEEAYFDAVGKPVAGAEGCPRWVWSQEEPQALRGAGFDAEGRPMRTRDGSHSCLRHFEGQGGKCLAEAYFGLDGKPWLHKEGYHRCTARYDERGNQIEEAYFGLDGRPVARVDEGAYKGCAKLTWEYDDQGKLRECGYFVPDGKG